MYTYMYIHTYVHTHFLSFSLSLSHTHTHTHLPVFSFFLDAVFCNNNCVQYTTTHCNKLQHTATHCNTLQHKGSRSVTIIVCCIAISRLPVLNIYTQIYILQINILHPHLHLLSPKENCILFTPCGRVL